MRSIFFLLLAIVVAVSNAQLARRRLDVDAAEKGLRGVTSRYMDLSADVDAKVKVRVQQRYLQVADDGMMGDGGGDMAPPGADDDDDDDDAPEAPGAPKEPGAPGDDDDDDDGDFTAQGSMSMSLSMSM